MISVFGRTLRHSLSRRLLRLDGTRLANRRRCDWIFAVARIRSPPERQCQHDADGACGDAGQRGSPNAECGNQEKPGGDRPERRAGRVGRVHPPACGRGRTARGVPSHRHRERRAERNSGNEYHGQTHHEPAQREEQAGAICVRPFQQRDQSGKLERNRQRRDDDEEFKSGVGRERLRRGQAGAHTAASPRSGREPAHERGEHCAGRRRRMAHLQGHQPGPRDLVDQPGRSRARIRQEKDQSSSHRRFRESIRRGSRYRGDSGRHLPRLR